MSNAASQSGASPVGQDSQDREHYVPTGADKKPCEGAQQSSNTHPGDDDSQIGVVHPEEGEETDGMDQHKRREDIDVPTGQALSPGKVGSKAPSDVKSKAEAAACNLQDVEPKPIGEKVQGGDEAAKRESNLGDKLGSKVGSLESEANDVASKAGDAIQEGKQKIEEAGGKATKTAQEGTEEAGEVAEGATGKADEAVEGAQDKADEAVKDTKKEAGEAAEGAEDKASEAVEGAQDKAGEAVKGTKKEDEVAEAAKAEAAKAEAKGTVEGAQEKAGDAIESAGEQLPDLSILKGGKVNKGGNIVNDEGKVVGRIKEGVLAHLVGKKVDESGVIWNDSGKQIGKAELIPENELEDLSREPAPFEAFPGATVDGKGFVVFKGEQVGKVVEGDIKKLRGMTVDADGDILDRGGNAVGKAERWEPEEPEEPKPEPEADLSALKGGKVNKGGNVVDSDGKVMGRIKEGALARLIGKRVDEKGAIWNDTGEIIGKAELIPPDEIESISKKAHPFEAFPDATVDADGFVVFKGEQVGKIVEGDAKQLRGMSVDEDGDILDRGGNVVGKAERWEPEPEPEVDRSVLAGKRVNKAGNVVDSSGTIYGRVVEGDPKRMVGRMCDKKGNILSESGDIIGRAEVVTEGEREGLKEGPFAELSGCTVAKDGKVVTPGGDVVGRLVSGDPKVLFGRSVDEDGDVCDRNGNVLGKAERWEEPVVEKKKNPLSGRRVNREGNVVDEEGNLVGKLTSGTLSICSGKEIDDDGDVVDSKGNIIGHVSLLEDIPPEPVEEESPEDKAKRELDEKDKELAKRMAVCLTQVLDKIKPICDMITSKIEKAERTPKDELDEEELVKEVRPLIEEGSKILTEANGIIRGLDPDGRIQANAKHKTATREASPEEYHLADILKELTGTVTKCIEDAKKKLEGMPHAKKELNPLWGLLSEPLFQILAAVGLLLNGVLGLVGRLLSGLGLGGLVDSLLGGLGVKQILEALGIGSLTDALTGKNKKKKSGGLLGLGG